MTFSFAVHFLTYKVMGQSPPGPFITPPVEHICPTTKYPFWFNDLFVFVLLEKCPYL